MNLICTGGRTVRAPAKDLPRRPSKTKGEAWPARLCLTALMCLALAGCAAPKPSVMLASSDRVTIPYRDNYGLLRYESHPTVEATINGVTGPFIIDTGATTPMLTMTGVRRCGIALAPLTNTTAEFWGEKVSMKMATNVTVQLAPALTVQWRKVIVHPGFDAFFGILDYGTLKAGHAVIDFKQKTITMSR